MTDSKTVNITAAAAALAAEHGLDPTKITGTGMGDDRIIVADVRRALANGQAKVEPVAFDSMMPETWIDPERGLTLSAYALAASLAKAGDDALAKGQQACEKVMIDASRTFMIGIGKAQQVRPVADGGIDEARVKQFKNGLRTLMAEGWTGSRTTKTIDQMMSRVLSMMKHGVTPDYTILKAPCVRYLKDGDKMTRSLEVTDVKVTGINMIKVDHWIEGNARSGGLRCPGLFLLVSNPTSCQRTVDGWIKGARGANTPVPEDEVDQGMDLFKGLDTEEQTCIRTVAESLRALAKAGDKEYADKVLKDLVQELTDRMEQLLSSDVPVAAVAKGKKN